jgi:hypothetical protein
LETKFFAQGCAAELEAVLAHVPSLTTGSADPDLLVRVFKAGRPVFDISVLILHVLQFRATALSR